MYVRFAVLGQHDESHQATEIFHAAFELRDSDVLAHEREWLEKDLAWLKMHLKSSSCLRERGNKRAISWFKPEATRPIEKVRAIAASLKEHGLLVRQHTTTDPGTIIYENGWQIAAKPLRKGAREIT